VRQDKSLPKKNGLAAFRLPSRLNSANFLRQNFNDGFIDGVLRDKADDLVRYLAVLEKKKGRNTADTITHRRGCVRVDVHLHALQFAVILVGNFVSDRGQGSARTAPGGPKITQNGLSRLENI